MNPPQSVTERYITNLLHRGFNNDFAIDMLCSVPNMARERVVGYYYKVRLVAPSDDHKAYEGVGATPISALQHSLEQFGVTFR